MTRHKSGATACSLCAWLLFAAIGAGAQAPPPGTPAEVPAFGEQIDVTEVLLDIVAVDKKGRPVEGLGPDDFQVEENGQPVNLTGVSFYSTRYAQPATGAAASSHSAAAGSELPASRYFIFFFHDQRRNAGPGNQLMQQQLDAGRKSRAWIEHTMGPSDWAAVLSYDVRLNIHQDFTQNREALEQAIEQATVGSHDPGIRTPRQRRRAIADGPSIFRNLPSGPTLEKQTARIYDGLRVAAEATGYLVGRKNLLLFSIGFGRLDGTPFARPDPRYYPALEHALNANNVAVYPLDLTPNGIDHIQENFLNQLAADSGGYYFRNFVSFAVPLARIARENTGYYLLSYSTPRARDAAHSYRTIKVRTTRPKVTLRAPRGVEIEVGS